MEAFSLAVRQRIIQLFRSGLEGEDIAQILACSASGARRVWQRFREEGRVGPRPHAGGQPPKLDPQRREQVLRELVAQKPDAFCRELADDLHARTGVRFSRQTVGTWLAGLGLTRKKSRCVPRSRTARTCGHSVSSGSTRSPRPARAILPA